MEPIIKHIKSAIENLDRAIGEAIRDGEIDAAEVLDKRRSTLINELFRRARIINGNKNSC